MARVHERFVFIIKNKTERAVMARLSKQSVQVIKDKSVIVMDCGASQTITCSLINCKEVKEKKAKIETEDGDDSMKSALHASKHILSITEWEKLLQSLCQHYSSKYFPEIYLDESQSPMRSSGWFWT